MCGVNSGAIQWPARVCIGGPLNGCERMDDGVYVGAGRFVDHFKLLFGVVVVCAGFKVGVYGTVGVI